MKKKNKQKEGKYEKHLRCGKGNGQNLGEELLTIKPKGQSRQKTFGQYLTRQPILCCKSQTMEENHSFILRASQASS